MIQIPRRVFTGEFKQEAVKLVIEQGLKKSEVSRRLDVSLKSLGDWIKQAKAGVFKGSLWADKLTVEQQRIRELERELAIAQMMMLDIVTTWWLQNERTRSCVRNY